MSTVHSSHVVKTPVIVSSGWTCDASRRSTRAFTPGGRWLALADVQTISAQCLSSACNRRCNFQQKIFARVLVLQAIRSRRPGFARAAVEQRARLGFVLRKIFERRIEVFPLPFKYL